jgi:hypothetical protein
MQETLELLAFAAMMSGQFLAVIAGRTWHTIAPDAFRRRDAARPRGRLSEA